MAIDTRDGIAGFIASEPRLAPTEKGVPRYYSRFGQEHYQREQDGSFTKLETTFGDLVMFGRTAEEAYSRFHKGDNFLAQGDVRAYTDQNGQERDEFIARRIGHDTARTRYDVDRTPRNIAGRETPERATTRETTERRQQQREAPADNPFRAPDRRAAQPQARTL
ncbi:single-stranded DNA-binding protein [Dermacoccus nishinomiyaensis]